jgi:hypothetical protein
MTMSKITIVTINDDSSLTKVIEQLLEYGCKCMIPSICLDEPQSCVIDKLKSGISEVGGKKFLIIYPETGMHIKYQRQVIPLLEEYPDDCEFTVITHAPSIILNRWDLVKQYPDDYQEELA